jgi:hypothetical protein
MFEANLARFQKTFLPEGAHRGVVMPQTVQSSEYEQAPALRDRLLAVYFGEGEHPFRPMPNARFG